MNNYENLLDYIGYHDKWHGTRQSQRTPYVYNQNEHLTKEILDRMNIEEGVCVEFGAWDGLYNSNTKNLIDKGWQAILIEPDEQKYTELVRNFSYNSRVRCVKSFVNDTNSLLDDILRRENVEEIDFCSIDIDGLDLDVFEAVQEFLPKLVCIEGGQVIHPRGNRISTDISKNNIQQSLKVMVQSFEYKGYKLLCSYQDAFFIKKEYYHLFNVDENLMNQYINDLLALPRIPYIKKLLDENNLHNSVLEYALKDVPDSITDYVARATKKYKMRWVDDFYANIQGRLEELRE